MELNVKKVCSKCKKEKSFSDFYKCPTGRDGYSSKCKDCLIAYRREYRRKNKDRVLAAERRSAEKHRDIRNRRINAHNHGMTLEEYDEFFAVRNHQCEVCGLSQQESYKLFSVNLHIDHCHESGENKGLLCCMCNPAAGNLKDNPDLAFRLWKYLERTRRKEGKDE